MPPQVSAPLTEMTANLQTVSLENAAEEQEER